MPSIPVEDDAYLRISLEVATSMLSLKQREALQQAVEATLAIYESNNE
jgi:hypothetical protein